MLSCLLVSLTFVAKVIYFEILVKISTMLSYEIKLSYLCTSGPHVRVTCVYSFNYKRLPRKVDKDMVRSHNFERINYMG